MPAQSQFYIQALDPAKHRREAFDCGAEPLNRYLREQARLDLKRRAAGCWVLVATDNPAEVLGYYTLSSESVLVAELPPMPKPEQKRLPPYSRLGAWLLGRLAVSASRHGQGLGGLLLADALRRCLRSEIPAVFVVVDPKDTAAVAFYEKFGFRPLTATRMFLPMHETALFFDQGRGN
jgi:ribosomal protein S18 acetylase RimI-like enzyme